MWKPKCSQHVFMWTFHQRHERLLYAGQSLEWNYINIKLLLAVLVKVQPQTAIVKIKVCCCTVVRPFYPFWHTISSHYLKQTSQNSTVKRNNSTEASQKILCRPQTLHIPHGRIHSNFPIRVCWLKHLHHISQLSLASLVTHWQPESKFPKQLWRWSCDYLAGAANERANWGLGSCWWDSSKLF